MTTDNTPDPSKKNFEVIKPADFSQIDQTTASTQAATEVAESSSKLALIFALLGLTAALVFVALVLPKLVSEPATTSTVSTTPASGNSSSPAPAATTPTIAAPEPSPYTEAQLAKQRKDAQAALELLLEQQNTLEELSVELWADADFKQAKELAVTGDASYRNRQFQQATDEYTQANEILTGILEGKDELLAKVIKAGNEALMLGQKDQAIEAFTLVSKIDPGNTAATNGLKRAETIEQVLPLLRQAKNQQDDAQYADAIQSYEQVLGIDPLASEASTAIASIKATQREQEFGRLMTRGLASIDSGNATTARDYFNKAAKIKPSDPGVKDGLRQASQMLGGARIKAYQGDAASYERQEDWAKVIEVLDTAIAKEGQLSGFTERRDAATRRLQLDERLENIIKKPELLSDDNAYQAAQDIQEQAQAIRSPGPKLSGQLAQVDQLLISALIPISVVIESDNLTEVNVFKVARLGKIASKSLTLKPGKYVITGTRNGYRDVREEIIISAADEGKRIRIACTQAI